MADRRLTPEQADLERARAAARECEVVAGQLADFATHLSAVVTPADMAEFDMLVAREATARSRRIDAFGQLGLGVGSLEATGTGD